MSFAGYGWLRALALVGMLLLIEPEGTLAKPVAATGFLYAGIADPNGVRACIYGAGGDGFDVIELSLGIVLWSVKGHDRPVWMDGAHVVTQTPMDYNGKFRLRVLAASSGTLTRETAEVFAGTFKDGDAGLNIYPLVEWPAAHVQWAIVERGSQGGAARRPPTITDSGVDKVAEFNLETGTVAIHPRTASTPKWEYPVYERVVELGGRHFTIQSGATQGNFSFTRTLKATGLLGHVLWIRRLPDGYDGRLAP